MNGANGLRRIVPDRGAALATPAPLPYRAARSPPVSLLLRIAAVLAVLRALGFGFCKPVVLGKLAEEPLASAMATGLAVSNLGFAFVFWRAAANPAGERTALYASMLVTGLRGATAVYDVLYLLDGHGAVISLIDMIANVTLFVGMVNSLAGVLRGPAYDE